MTVVNINKRRIWGEIWCWGSWGCSTLAADTQRRSRILWRVWFQEPFVTQTSLSAQNRLRPAQSNFRCKPLHPKCHRQFVTGLQYVVATLSGSPAGRGKPVVYPWIFEKKTKDWSRNQTLQKTEKSTWNILGRWVEILLSGLNTSVWGNYFFRLLPLPPE